MKSRWIAVVLVVSLACNLVVAGYLLGSRSQQLIGGDPTRGYPRWVRSLPEPRREALRPLVMKHMRAMRPGVRTMHQQNLAMRTALSADPFDQATLQATLTELREEAESVQRTTHESFVEFVAQLTPAERQKLSKEMDNRRSRHNPRSTHRPPTDRPFPNRPLDP